MKSRVTGSDPAEGDYGWMGSGGRKQAIQKLGRDNTDSTENSGVIRQTLDDTGQPTSI